MRMEKGLDTGPLYACRTTPIGPRETAGSLHDRLATMAAELLLEMLPAIAAGTTVPTPQPAEGVTYAAKIGAEDQRLDFARAAVELDRQVRALSPAPGAWCRARGERLHVLEAEPVDAPAGEPGEIVVLPLTVACGTGALALRRVQRAGRKAISAEELQRGFPLSLGSRLD
jgi:methionyl-tRNA formyltransferase